MALDTVASRTVNKLTSLPYTSTLQSNTTAGTALALSLIDTVALTLKDVATGTIINSRDEQDAKNANNVTIHATTGLLTWEMQAADNAIVTSTTAHGLLEHHRATFDIVYDTTKRMTHSVDIYVEQNVDIADS